MPPGSSAAEGRGVAPLPADPAGPVLCERCGVLPARKRFCGRCLYAVRRHAGGHHLVPPMRPAARPVVPGVRVRVPAGCVAGPPSAGWIPAEGRRAARRMAGVN